MISLKRLFGGVGSHYLIRSYVLGMVFFLVAVTMVVSSGDSFEKAAVVVGYFSICTLAFPFAKLVWDELKAVVLGHSFLVLPIVFLYPAKLIVNFLLWGFALLIAPFGLIYIWFRTRAS